MSSNSKDWKYVNIRKPLEIEIDRIRKEGGRGKWHSKAHFVDYWLTPVVYFYDKDRKRLEKLRNDYEEAMLKERSGANREPSAGQEQSPIKREESFFCRYCGTENEPDAVYCEKCGKKVGR